MAVCNGTTDDILHDLFTNLKALMDEDTKIKLLNCPAIQEISVAAATREIQKLLAIEYFRKMFQSSSSSDPETIQKLKKVLHPDPEATGTLAVVQEFVHESSLDFRLSLLNRLEEVCVCGVVLTVAGVSHGGAS
jgi:hypothetical protein